VRATGGGDRARHRECGKCPHDPSLPATPRRAVLDVDPRARDRGDPPRPAHPALRAHWPHPVKRSTSGWGALDNVGVGYLSLERAAATLSDGEAQRIRLATQIGSSLVGVLYILDEPSIGLHQRDNERLIATLERLRELGNTVIGSADWLTGRYGSGAARGRRCRRRQTPHPRIETH
jgi:hypothetical protein